MIEIYELLEKIYYLVSLIIIFVVDHISLYLWKKYLVIDI